MSARDLEPAFLSGTHWGLPASTQVHRLANIAGKLECGEDCRIDAFVTVTGNAKLGDNCHLSTGSAIFGSYGFEMGNGCALSPGVKVFTATDDLESGYVSSHADAKIRKAVRAGAIKFGNYVVIGSNSVVLPGVEIGDAVQVGALSLVNRSLKGHGIYAGVPARFIRVRPKLLYCVSSDGNVHVY